MKITTGSKAVREINKWDDFLPSRSQVMRNIGKVAMPLITTGAISLMPAAGAGPITWAACIVSCEAVAAAATAATSGAAAASLIACVKACGPVLYLPFCT